MTYKMRTIFVIISFVAMVVCVLQATKQIEAENTIKPPPVEYPATTEREEIVTGVCTFGDCPVASLPATEMSVANTTEPATEDDEKSSATELVSDSYTFDSEPVAKNATTESGYIGKFYITGYTAEEGFPEGSATASGYGVRPGYCAMNDSQRRSLGIRYGDQIYVDGLGTYTVMDCGCDWGVVDIWVYTNAEAYSITENYDVYLV